MIINALKDWGWAVAIAVALFAFGLSWQVANPLEEVSDRIAEPIGQSIGVVDSQCPGGWDYEGPKIGGTVAVEPRCLKDGYIARLDPIDKRTCQTAFDSGTKTRPGRGEITCAEAGFPQ